MKALIYVLAVTAAYAQGDCPAIAIAAAQDYSAVTGSAAGSGASYRWLVNDAPVASGAASQLALVHADGTANDERRRPAGERRRVFTTSRDAGDRRSLFDHGASLAYAREGQFNPSEGTAEMWVALRGSGRDDVYVSRSHVLFQYTAANGDNIGIVQASGGNGILYAGGTVNGAWQSA